MGLILLVFGAALLFIGIALIVVGRYAADKQVELVQKCTASAEAELVDTVCHSTEYTDEFVLTYHGVYVFTARDGRRVQTENEFGYGMPENVPGPLVSIRYNPDDPTEFLLPEEQVSASAAMPSFKKAGVITLVLGVPLTIAGLVFFGA